MYYPSALTERFMVSPCGRTQDWYPLDEVEALEVAGWTDCTAMDYTAQDRLIVERLYATAQAAKRESRDEHRISMAESDRYFAMHPF